MRYKFQENIPMPFVL